MGGFHQLGRCVREGRESSARSGFADLALCFAFPVSVSPEGQMTLSRRLPLMKTARFLAGLPDICAHPGIGAARDKSPDPLSPLSHSSGASAAVIGDESPSRLSLRVRKSLGWCLSRSLLRRLSWLIVAGAPIPIPACRFAQSRLESIGPLCAPSSRWCPHNEKQAKYKGVPWFPTRCRE